MYWRITNSWLKYIDFIILDLIVMEMAFVLSILIRSGASFGNLLQESPYREMPVILFLVLACVIFLSENYKGILERGYLKEMKAAARQTGYVAACGGLYLFLTKQSGDYSRISFFCFILFYFLFSYIVRCLWKGCRKKYGNCLLGKRAVMLLASPDMADDMSKHMESTGGGDIQIIGFGLVGNTDAPVSTGKYQIVAEGEVSILNYIQNYWVDEVMIQISSVFEYPQNLIDICCEMGVTVHQCLSSPVTSRDNQILEKMYGYPVLTTCIRAATTRQAFMKRFMDICGSIVGLIITGFLFLIIGPLIYITSPGPVLFSQERIGKGGKRFRIYKFRSMYIDAEKRKYELMEQNKINGCMFKIESDPRIIGSGKDGTRHGLGWFIRKTSIDEFPQFWNVLKGEMSLVGTRPPTVDEWEKYDFHHRGRMATKPGLTGLWQVSGRSGITDFEEVVRLDMEYIQQWTLSEDIKILCRTVGAVLRGVGAE